MRIRQYCEKEADGGRLVCSLYENGHGEPVSRLSVVRFTIRFGGTAVAAEGLAGVHTVPQHRRKGHITTLMDRCLDSMGRRVKVAFLYGIEQLYGKFGFVSCLPESRLTLWTGRTASAPSPSGYRADSAGTDDMPRIIELFNHVHRERPWTGVRTLQDADKYGDVSLVQPGAELLVVRGGGGVAAYALILGGRYGGRNRQFTVAEAAAETPDAAMALLKAIGRKCAERHLQEFSIMEPADSMVGRAAMRLACSETVETPLDGGGMAALLHRDELVRELADELARRVTDARQRFGFRSDSQAPERVRECVELLATGSLVPDGGQLLRLLFGFWSLDDAIAAGARTPDELLPMLHAMFPGGGTVWLPRPYSHHLDRY